jgi:dTMP kinase
MVNVAGFFITLEGVDGGGKTTQARLLADWLQAEGHCVLLTRQPGGTAIGEQLRELVLSPQNHITPEAELFLYLADRAVHVAEVVVPALQRGCVVVCERYTDSTLAYQGYGRGLDLELLRRLNELATGGVTPDLTLVLDIPAAEARLDVSRLDRLESAGDGFRERVAEGFRALARGEPERMKLVDGRQSIPVVQAQINSLVRAALTPTRPAEGP